MSHLSLPLQRFVNVVLEQAVGVCGVMCNDYIEMEEIENIKIENFTNTFLDQFKQTWDMQFDEARGTADVEVPPQVLEYVNEQIETFLYCLKKVNGATCVTSVQWNED